LLRHAKPTDATLFFATVLAPGLVYQEAINGRTSFTGKNTLVFWVAEKSFKIISL
jgi:hypothetical protein